MKENETRAAVCPPPFASSDTRLLNVAPRCHFHACTRSAGSSTADLHKSVFDHVTSSESSIRHKVVKTHVMRFSDAHNTQDRSVTAGFRWWYIRTAPADVTVNQLEFDRCASNMWFLKEQFTRNHIWLVTLMRFILKCRHNILCLLLFWETGYNFPKAELFCGCWDFQKGESSFPGICHIIKK